MCFGELAVILCSFVFAGVHVTVLGLLWDNISSAPQVSGFPLQFMRLRLQ